MNCSIHKYIKNGNDAFLYRIRYYDNFGKRREKSRSGFHSQQDAAQSAQIMMKSMRPNSVCESAFNGYIYRFLNLSGDVIYVGKTTNMKRRMLGHFTPSSAILPSHGLQSIAMIQ